MSRIYGDKVTIDPDKVRQFFEGRGQSVNPDHPLTSVLYQDRNPRLAEERDAYEKGKVLPMLHLEAASRVLDLGCGIGRWADVLKGHVAGYVGVDLSESLVEVARKRIQAPGFEFVCSSIDSMRAPEICRDGTFSHVILAGVLIYMNDDQVRAALNEAARCCDTDAVFYVREPVALERRLTLREFWSDDLNSGYSAIYRTGDEMTAIFADTLEAAGFLLVHRGDLYPPELNNRRETVQNIFLFRRK